MKTHATEYLVEYQGQSGLPVWLVGLITKAINSEGKITEEEKETSFNELQKELGLEANGNTASNNPLPVTSQTQPNNNNHELFLQKVLHNKGVNALIPAQVITFSPTCTIIYGLNGTGKSGYFRIINEIAGGTRTKKILGNIHAQGEDLDVEIDYHIDNVAQPTYLWKDKAVRDIFPFNQIKVFDSEYLPLFLNERESSVNIEPLGLHLFQCITNIIDEFKARLDELKLAESSNIPELRPLIGTLNAPELRQTLSTTRLTKDSLDLLKKHLSFSDSDKTTLETLIKQKEALEKQNIEDAKKVIYQEKTELNNLDEHLGIVSKNFSELEELLPKAINELNASKKSRDEQKLSYGVLKSVPAQSSDTWQKFIESASDYAVEAHNDEHFNPEENCIYCHQTLSGDSLNLVQAYSKYLSDQSQNRYKLAEQQLLTLKQRLERITTGYTLSDNLKSLLELVEINNQKLTVLINNKLSDFNNAKKALETAISEKNSEFSSHKVEVTEISAKLKFLSSEKQEAYDKLNTSELKRRQELTAFDGKIKSLEDNERITTWKDSIKLFFSTHQKIEKYEKAKNSLHTRAITDLGTKAHNELLTEKIRVAFEDQLKLLKKDIEITLEKTGAGKGKVRNRLRILGNDVPDILSEGEQKTVGLALFLAEIESQQDKCPIVFDDPVNSLDHEIAHLLAKNLIELSNRHQLIIFTHNRLFYDSLLYWGENTKDSSNQKSHHICKNYITQGCNGKGCHVYTYRVDRESKDRTGRILEAQNESLNYYIAKAEDDLKGTYSVSVVAGYLKSAIEHCIDEKVLNNQGLVKDQKLKDHIEWEELKKINIQIPTIDQLKAHWDELSNRGTHLTANSNEIPLSNQELTAIINYLKSL